jgi:hypothetical protein
MSEYVVTEEIRTIDYTDFFSQKPGKRDIAVFIVTAPDGSVKEFNSDDFDFVLDARIAADSYADEHNLIHYRTTIAQQQAEIERLKSEVANYRDDLKTIIDNIFHGKWTPDRVRRFAIEVLSKTGDKHESNS